MKAEFWSDDEGHEFVCFDCVLEDTNVVLSINTSFFKDPHAFVRAFNREVEECGNDIKQHDLEANA